VLGDPVGLATAIVAAGLAAVPTAAGDGVAPGVPVMPQAAANRSARAVDAICVLLMRERPRTCHAEGGMFGASVTEP